jgi:3-deoxy-D-manno-octulosonate 8-phosphate phosphatase (KDO 8-P phosphatase)
LTALPEDGEVGRSVRLIVFDFDGVFTDNTVWTDGTGNEWVRSWRGDGLGLAMLREVGVLAWVLSTEIHPVVGRRCEKLGIPYRQGITDKRAALEALASEVGVLLEEVAYVGNDINDAGCLSAVGVPIVVQDAHPDVLPLARYRTRSPGGFGAVREICDWLSASAAMPVQLRPS